MALRKRLDAAAMSKVRLVSVKGFVRSVADEFSACSAMYIVKCSDAQPTLHQTAEPVTQLQRCTQQTSQRHL